MSLKRNREIPSSAMLDKPCAALPGPSMAESFCFYSILLALAALGAMGCLYSAFQIPVDRDPLLLTGVAVTLLCTLQFMLPRRQWVVALGMTGIWALLSWLFFQELVQGCVSTLNLILAAYGEKLGRNFSLLSLPLETTADPQHCITLFAAFLLFPLIWILSWLLVRHKSFLGAFCFTGLFLLSSMALSILPETWALGVLLLFWAFLLLASPSLCRRQQLVGERGRFQASGKAFGHPVSLLLLPLLALCMAVIYALFPPEEYQRPQFASEVREGIFQGVNLSAMLRGGTGSGGSRVDLASLGDREYTGKTALEVQHQWNSGTPTLKKDFLKSFVGSVYTGDSWEPLSQRDAAASVDALDGQKAQTLPAALAISLPGGVGISDSYTVSVRKVDVDLRSVYSPYGLYLPHGISDKMDYADDGFVKSSNRLSGPKEYSLAAIALPETGTCFLNRFQRALVWGQAESNTKTYTIPGGTDGNTMRISGDTYQFYQFDGNTIQIFVDDENQSLLGELRMQILRQLEEDPLTPPDLWELPDWAKKAMPDEEAQRLLEQSVDYSRFVYDQYTRLPESTRQFAEKYMADHGLVLPPPNEDIEGNYSLAPSIQWQGDPANGFSVQIAAGCAILDDHYLEYAQSVRDLLAEECRYSLTPPTMPPGADFAEYFLEDSKQGYCVHFATAAVVLLRAAGIPARYAEGYAVPVDSAGRWINVPDYNAHAWVEIYWGGSGWLPFEVTPSGPDAPAAYDNAILPDNSGSPVDLALSLSTPKPGSKPGEDREKAPAAARPEPTRPPQADGPGKTEVVSKAEDKGTPVIFWLCVAFSLPILAFLFLWALRLIRLARRKRAFRQKDRNKAALRVYAHLLRLYQENYVLPYGGVEPPEEIEELALRARFSSHTLTKEELKRMTDLAADMEKRLSDNLADPIRLQCKYVKALF